MVRKDTCLQISYHMLSDTQRYCYTDYCVLPRNLNLNGDERNVMEAKRRFKLFKNGKSWCVGAATIAALGASAIVHPAFADDVNHDTQTMTVGISDKQPDETTMHHDDNKQTTPVVAQQNTTDSVSTANSVSTVDNQQTSSDVKMATKNDQNVAVTVDKQDATNIEQSAHDEKVVQIDASDTKAQDTKAQNNVSDNQTTTTSIDVKSVQETSVHIERSVGTSAAQHVVQQQPVQNRGFVTNQNKTYYYNDQGQVTYGQQKINQNWYLFNATDGAMQVGFQNIPEQKKTVYYATDGQMQYGQQRIQSKWYLFDKRTGAMKTGFQMIPEQQKTVYYANNGQMQYGQQRIQKNWYLFNAQTGAMKTGFQNIANQHKTVYYATDGRMQYGQQRINRHWYLFQKQTGAMQTGIQYIPEQHKTVYYATDGQMQYGQQVIANAWYQSNKITGALTYAPNQAHKVDIVKTVEWFEANKNKLTYSMYGSRNGTDGTADCSGSVTEALYEAGATQPDYLYSTEGLHRYLLANGFKLVVDNDQNGWHSNYGDVVIWGQKGYSLGAGGHVGLISSSDDDNPAFISTCYYTGGQKNTAVQELSYNDFVKRANYPYYYVYRLA